MTQIDDPTSVAAQLGTEDSWSEPTLSGSTAAPAAEAYILPSDSGRPTSAARPSSRPAGVDRAGARPGARSGATRPATRPGLRLKRTGARRVPFAVLLLGVLAGGMCALLALNTATAASEVRERRLDADNATLNATQEQLSRTISGLQAPSQLGRMAAALGMVPAGSPAYLQINANGTVTVLGHPAAIAAPPKVVKLTPAQKAAATAAAKAKAAREKAAKTKATTAKATTAKATTAKATTAKATTAKATTAKATTSKAPATKVTTAPGTTPPSAKSTGTPASTSPSPTRTSPATTPVPTITISGGPR